MMKNLLEEFLRKGHRLLKLCKREVSRPYPTLENACKGLKRVVLKTKNTLIGKNRQNSSYEPSNIWATRESLFWKWKMVKEYYRNFSDDDQADKIMKEVKALIFS